MDYSDKPWIKRYDPGIPPSLEPYPEHPLHGFLEKSAQEHPDNVATLMTAKLPLLGRQQATLTYRQVNEAADALAAALVDMGLKKGDRVAIVMPNITQFVISFYGILKAGGVVAATNPTYPPAKMQEQLDDCDARFAIAMSLFYPALKRIQAGTKLESIIATNVKEYLPPAAKFLFSVAKEKKEGHAVELQPGDHWFQDILSRYAGQKPNVEVGPEDICIFQYTGGTTGVPKAAMSQHKALVANTVQMRTWLGEVDVSEGGFLAAIPLFHVYGMVAVLSFAISMAARMIMVPNARDTTEVVECIHTYKPAIFMGVPALYNAVNNHKGVVSGKYDLSSIEACISGSAPLPPVTKQRFEELTGGKLLEGFGMSEAPTATHCNPLRGENRTGSIGLPFPDVECRIVSLDDEVTDVPVGDVGELVLRGPQLMVGYHKLPTETANALRDGWLYTGDIARMDEDGYFYIVDRKKDMVLIGGFNVYPTNVERVLSAHPAVLEIGVAGIPHPDPEKVGQEALKAWVVIKDEYKGKITPEQLQKELIELGKEKLARYEIPTRFAFVDELPKTTVGKVLRRELVRMELEEREKETGGSTE